MSARIRFRIGPIVVERPLRAAGKGPYRASSRAAAISSPAGEAR